MSLLGPSRPHDTAVSDGIRQHTRFELTYSRRAKENAQIQSYILRESRNTISVHFLWWLHYRRQIVEATADLACAYKPQIAYYSAIGAEGELAMTIAFIKENYPAIPIILDAKRSDIGSTARMYAREAFERYGADAVTVNPYMGSYTGAVLHDP